MTASFPSNRVGRFDRPETDERAGRQLPDDARPGAEFVNVLDRWQQSGAVWRVIERGRSHVTVALLRCDGGEEVERLTSADPLWLAHLRGREGSDD